MSSWNTGLQIFICTAVLLVLHPEARGQVYKWVDKKGTVHFTDNPDELPEPQRSEALRKLDEKLKKKKKKKPVPPRTHQGRPWEKLPPATSPAGSPASVDRSAEIRQKKKKRWQARAAQARARVAELEEKCKRIEAQRHKSSRDSLIFARPGDRQKSAENTAALKECKDSLEQARHYLQVELPEEARRQKVPPGWLR